MALVAGLGDFGRSLIQAQESCASFFGVGIPSGSGIRRAEGEIDFGLFGEGLLSDFQLGNCFEVGVGVQVEQSQQIMRKGEIGVEAHGVFRVGNAGG